MLHTLVIPEHSLRHYHEDDNNKKYNDDVDDDNNNDMKITATKITMILSYNE